MSTQRRPPARSLYDRVEEIRMREGWSKIQLARRLGLDRGTIEKWKTQPRVPLASTVRDVSERLGIPLDEALALAGVTGGQTVEDEPERAATMEELAERTRELERELARLTREQKDRDLAREERTQQLEAGVAAMLEQVRVVLGDEAADRIQKNLDDERRGEDERHRNAG